jgi:hypothetical protein
MAQIGATMVSGEPTDPDLRAIPAADSPRGEETYR